MDIVYLLLITAGILFVYQTFFRADDDLLDRNGHIKRKRWF